MEQKERTIEKYTPRKHVLKRPERYIGSTTFKFVEDYKLLREHKTLNFQQLPISEAYYKMIDEVIDNAVDEYICVSKTINKQYKIQIQIHPDLSITVSDSGRGLSTELLTKDIDGQTIEPHPQAYYAFCSLQAGSNFNDDGRETAGLHGEGVSIVNILSKKFSVISKNKTSVFYLTCLDNMEKIDYSVKPSFDKNTGTSVTFLPDFSIIEIGDLKFEDIQEHLYKRCTEIRQFFHDIEIKLQGEIVNEKLSNYIHGEEFQHQDYFLSIVFGEKFGKDIGYVNGIYTSEGGTHIDAFNTIVQNELRWMIQNKFKMDLKPRFIKKFFNLALFIKIKNAKFGNQNKSVLTNDFNELIKTYSTDDIKWFVSNCFKKHMSIFHDAIKGIIEAANAKRMQELQKEIKNKKKEFNPDFHDIVGNDYGNATLFLFEGKSAISNFRAVRNSKIHAGMALRGKFINVYEFSDELHLLNNKVAKNIISAADLDFENQSMRFKEIALCTDSDVDGDHIYVLLTSFFIKFFPKLVNEGRIVRYKSPIVIARKGKEEKRFCLYADFKNEEHKLSGWHIDYFKGLGSLKIEHYDEMINDPTIEVVTMNENCEEVLKIAFDKSDEYKLKRKAWIVSGDLSEQVNLGS